MPVFNDSNNIPPLLDAGDYVYTVVGFDIGISQGSKTRGCEKYEVELAIEPTGKKVTEILTDHESTAWKIDCFLKSAGVQLAKGEAFEFRQDIAKQKAVKWVNPLGLRGWCRLKQDTMPATAQYPNPRTTNKVEVFYTDREKLAPVRIEAEDESNKPF